MSKSFNSYMDTPEMAFWRELCVNEGELCRYERGEEFVTIGEPARYIGYIHSGTLKYMAFSETGDAHVVGLEFAGEFVADFPFSLYGMKARVSIVADTPSEIYRVPVKNIMARMAADPQVERVVMLSTEAVFSTVYDRYMDLYRKSPQERYNELLMMHPDIFSLFSLKDIASFLKITPTHLSRLRRNI